jgi:hypothetical protein
MTMHDPAPTCLKLLAPDGIVKVTFARPLDGDQSIALLQATQAAKHVDDLQQSLQRLGKAWNIQTTTEIVSRTKRVMVMAPETKPANQ